ncbi:MAG: proton-conducting membrane transporter, partial [Ruminococcaceae bacterium]|nr:proton-conducting membrane transporter [Oscillospiraceae bacterium]
MKYFLLIPILFPIICGFGLLLSKNLGSRSRNILVASVTIATSLLTFAALYFFTEKLTLIKFGEHLVISFSVDGLSVFFALIASVLWPPATFFAFEYMKHEGNESRFFGFWLMSFGVTIAVAFSANPLTMYLFYELLSLSTLPLVMHAMNAKSRYAGRNYLLFSMGGAALAFVSLIFLIESGADTSFILGGFLGNYDGGSFYLYSVVFIFGFIGYGVKAAIFPFSKWLVDASVAPTPVTALLHAVAVVKAGIFAVIRLTWYSFGVAKLYGSFAQDVVLFFSAFTVLFGSYMALRTPHFKKRLAYSTVSNLSYMLIAVALMTGSALNAALMHMMFHALAKIVLFCCAGAVF